MYEIVQKIKKGFVDFAPNCYAMNLERMSLDQLRKLLIRIERQIVEDELYIENVKDGILREPAWKTGVVQARLIQKREERTEVKERIEYVKRKPVGG